MTAPTGPRAEACAEAFMRHGAIHQHVGICQRAGYANGRADEREQWVAAIEALAAFYAEHPDEICGRDTVAHRLRALIGDRP